MISCALIHEHGLHERLDRASHLVSKNRYILCRLTPFQPSCTASASLQDVLLRSCSLVFVIHIRLHLYLMTTASTAEPTVRMSPKAMPILLPNPRQSETGSRFSFSPQTRPPQRRKPLHGTAFQLAERVPGDMFNVNCPVLHLDTHSKNMTEVVANRHTIFSLESSVR